MPLRQAFTLIELAVVALIFAIAAALAAPRLGGGALLGSPLRRAATRLGVFMDRARDRAVSFHRTHWLVVERRSGEYALVAGDQDGNPAEEVARGALPEGIRFESVHLAGDGPASGDEVRIAFSPEGWMDDAALVLADEKGNVYTLLVSSAEGRIEVREGRADLSRLFGPAWRR